MPAPAVDVSEVERIRAALGAAGPLQARPARGLPVGLIIAGILFAAVLALVAVVQFREHARVKKPTPAPTASPTLNTNLPAEEIPNVPPTD
jgi:hypothetical protein